MEKEICYPIRILHVLNGLECGGAETLVMNLFRNIDRTKVMFDFVVHTAKEGFYEKEALNLGARIFRLPAYKIYNHIGYCKAWKNLLSQHPEWRTVHGHVYSIASVYLKIAKEKGRTTICHCHGVSNGNGLKGKIKDLYKLNICKYSDYKLACSESSALWMYGKKAVAEKKTKVLYNGIDLSKYSFDHKERVAVREKYGIREDTVLLGHTGRFSDCKNHSFLIDVFKEYNKKNPNSMLMLIGDGERRKNIEEQVVNAGLENKVVFTGIQANVSRYLQAMDLFLFPSLYEGLGIALIEAQANGLRCVVTDSESVPKESNISGETDFELLKSDLWVKAIERGLKKGRIKDTGYLKNSPYDIRYSVGMLSDIYLGAE